MMIDQMYCKQFCCLYQGRESKNGDFCRQCVIHFKIDISISMFILENGKCSRSLQCKYKCRITLCTRTVLCDTVNSFVVYIKSENPETVILVDNVWCILQLIFQCQYSFSRTANVDPMQVQMPQHIVYKTSSVLFSIFVL